MTRNKSAIVAEIKQNWTKICARAGVSENEPSLPLGSLSLLGSGSKTEKGEQFQYLTAICYMSPAWELWGSIQAAAGRTLCVFATGSGAHKAAKTDALAVGCIDSCLAVKAGRMVMTPVLNARRWKAALFIGNRQLWTELAHCECAALERKCRKLDGNWVPVVRFDGGSDTGVGAEIAESFPGVTFYDYTKVAHRARKFAAGNYPSNYSITFSFSGFNWAECLDIASLGVNIAAAFAKEIPSVFGGLRTFDADATDLRFRDTARGEIAALGFKSAKNKAKAAAKAGKFLIDQAGIRA